MEFQKAEQFILNKLNKELPGHLSYHSIHHVKDVMEAALRLAKSEGINDYDLQLLKMAVLFHDSGFTKQAKEHEHLGTKIASETLVNFGFTPLEIERICGMIMATKIPQTPHNLLEEIICDADLDYLGRDDYDTISYTLFKEINVNSKLDELNWLKLQIGFLEMHRYFTKSAIELRKEKKVKKLNELKKQLEEFTR